MDFPNALLNRTAVKFSISIKDEDHSYHDDFPEAEQIKWVEEQIEDGNEWGWCSVKVTARLEGYGIEEYDYLGSCSYKNEADFKAGGYYEQMEEAAFLNLNEKVSRMLSHVQNLSHEFNG